MLTIEEELQAAWQGFRAGNIRQTHETCRQIIAKAPKASEAWHLIGLAEFQLGRRVLALEYLNRAIELNPNAEPCHFDLALVFRSLGHLDDAARCYREIALRNPRSPASECLATISAYQRFNEPPADGLPRDEEAALIAWIEQASQIGMEQIEAEITGLCAFLQQQRLKNVLEIGSLWGGVFFLLCRLSSGKKISLDLPYPGTTEEDVQLRAAAMRGWAPQVFTVQGDSHNEQSHQRVAEVLGGDQLDFLLIDGDHSYEGAKLDYQMYRPFVRPGGWIAFHDIVDSDFHRRENCHVARLWQELAGEKREFNANSHWGGIGLVRVSLA